MLKMIVLDGKRSINAVESLDVFSNKTRFYSELLNIDPVLNFKERKNWRDQWHQNAMQSLNGCEIIFLEPDNGIEVRSVPIISVGKKWMQICFER